MATCTVSWDTTHQIVYGYGAGMGTSFYGPFLAMEDQHTGATTALTGTFTQTLSCEYGVVLATYKCIGVSTPVMLQQISGGDYQSTVQNPFALPPFSSPVTAGSLIVVALSWYTPLSGIGTVTVSDSLGQTYTVDVQEDLATNGACIQLYRFYNSAAGTCTISINSTSPNCFGAIAREYSNVSPTSALDKTAVGNAIGTSIATASTGTLSQTNELVICAVANATDDASAGTIYTAGSGYGNLWAGIGFNMSQTQANLLWSQSSGIGLTMTRTAPISYSSSSVPAITLESQMLLAAKNAGCTTIFAPFSTPPPDLKDNTSLVGGALNSSAYTTYANYQIAYIAYMNGLGLPITAFSIQNEPDATTSILSCGWTAAQLDAYAQVLFPLWNAAGYTGGNVLLCLPEQWGWRFYLADTVLADTTVVFGSTTVAQCVDVITAHYYSDNLYFASAPVSEAAGKQLWQTEYVTQVAGAFAYDPTMTAGLTLAVDMYNMFALANLTGFMYFLWHEAPASNSNIGLLGGADGITPLKIYYVLGQHSKFIRPGWIRIDETDTIGTSGGLYCHVYKSNDSSNKFAIVATNNTGSAITGLQFNLNGFIPAPTTVTPYITNASNNIAAQTSISVNSGTVPYFTATLPASTVTTFIGQLAPIVGWGHVQGNSASLSTGSLDSIQCTFPGPVTAGNLIIVSVAYYSNAQTQSVSDNINSQNYTYIAQGTVDNSNNLGTWWYVAPAGGMGFTVTFANSPTRYGCYASICIDEYTISTGGIIGLAASGFATGTSTTPQLGSALSVSQSSLIYSAIGNNTGGATASSAGTGFYLRSNLPNVQGGVCYGIANEDYVNEVSNINTVFNAAQSINFLMNSYVFNAIASYSLFRSASLSLGAGGPFFNEPVNG